MVEVENHSSLPSSPPQPPPSTTDNNPNPRSQSSPTTPQPQPQPQPPFNPSRMIGIIRRKAMIKDLAAMYHSECLGYCQELLELQRKAEEQLIDMKTTEDTRRETMRPSKRMKKTR